MGTAFNTQFNVVLFENFKTNQQVHNTTEIHDHSNHETEAIKSKCSMVSYHESKCGGHSCWPIRM